ncbi:hypothetical protein ASPACDRAFT_111315 [Aspergillus aculeatus ATCC 16872]|uniref:F-box domain-containing protein n=1 Tax=Aspergillus aculeatus (strain ATCC 16872 / CBS 172.66 / WB 5094) TaxID=690307 RepID=A0A1L9X4Z6_ASPA1|nr:uncharacterized protein ASPACDRAFT_111315 [Aspergillus aculeatus ATCC 16872]OJK03517.1 hypothetical protein ASPACDRAFT_111315 [Aspergillus aculeatus ATCC 16872]
MHPLLRNLMMAIPSLGTRCGYSRIPQSPEIPPLGSPQHGVNSLLRLPPHILEIILMLLPLPSRACLVLTCHTLYRAYKLIIRDPQLRFPRLLANRNPYISSSNPEVPRNILLHQLQNHHWAYCSGCLKLHPWNEMEDTDYHTTRGELSDARLRHLCNARAGIVDLCPCISLTARDKFRLVRHLAGTAEDKDRHHYPIEMDERFKLGLTLDGKRCLVHRCEIRDHPHVWIRLEVALYLYPNHNGIMSLYASTAYYVDLWSPARPDAMVPYFACPHRSLLYFAFSKTSRKTSCLFCNSVFTETGKHRFRDEGRNIRVLRNLGGLQWPPDKQWRKQRRHRAKISYNSYWKDDTWFWEWSRV